jgi:DNA gyrase subunit A
MARIAYLEDLLAHPKKILGVVKDDLNELANKYGDERRTRIMGDTHEELKEEDLVADEEVLITFTQKGYIKRVAANLYRTQGRGGRGVSGQTVREEDEVILMLPARTLHTILFFSDKGKVYSEKAYQIPDANRTDRGIPVVNVLSLGADEHVTAAVAVPNFDAGNYLIMATTSGRIKRLELTELASVRPSGLIAITLDDKDELWWAKVTDGSDDILLITRDGQALRIHEDSVRCMGRQAAGVTGIKLREGDRLASMEVVEAGGELLVVTEQGFGKRTGLDEYPVKGRATGGVATIDQKNLPKIGRIVGARVVQPEDEITIISSGGILLRLKTKEINSSGRATRGFRLMNLGAGDVVASLARIAAADLKKANGDAAKTNNGEPQPK